MSNCTNIVTESHKINLKPFSSDNTEIIYFTVCLCTTPCILLIEDPYQKVIILYQGLLLHVTTFALIFVHYQLLFFITSVNNLNEYKRENNNEKKYNSDNNSLL